MKIARAAVVLPLLLAGCGPDKAKIDACDGAWNARMAAVDAQAAILDKAQGADMKAVADATRTAETRLRALTVSHHDRDMYADKLKGVVATGKMRLSSATPTREDPPGKALRAVRFDLEITGDYRAIAKVVSALYGQPKAFFLDDLEVNITDEHSKLAILKGTGWVYEFEAPTAAPAGAAIPPAFAAAIVKSPGSPSECQGVNDLKQSRIWEAHRFALEARADQAAAAQQFADHETAAQSMTAMADDLVKRRDDNKAEFTSHADELVAHAKSAVTGLAELKFGASGEPLYK